MRLTNELYADRFQISTDYALDIQDDPGKYIEFVSWECRCVFSELFPS